MTGEKFSSSERGVGMVTALGFLILCILLAEFALNAARFYEMRSELKALAYEIANYSGTFLPDPELACIHAQRYFDARRYDLQIGKAQHGNVSMQLYFNAADHHNLLVSSCAPPIRGLPVEPFMVGLEENLELPVKSLRVHLRRPFSVGLFGLQEWASWTTSLAVSSEGTAQNVPTDVVLVIDNSNSVISPLNASTGAEIDALIPTGFKGSPTYWDRQYIGNCDAGAGDPSCDPTNVDDRAVISKAEVATRQCFGTVAWMMKRAALNLYDTLSASANIRLAVLHTHTTTDEFPMPQIALDQHPLYRGVPARPNNEVNANYRRYADGTFGIKVSKNTWDFATNTVPDDGNYPYEFLYGIQAGGYEETRCAVATETFPVPPHSLAGKTVMSLYTDFTSPTSIMASLSNGERDIFPHLRYAPNTMLLPRELIWATNNGFTGLGGYPIPKFDFIPLEIAVTRAIDVLANAPARPDGLPVQRQMVLVLTDGTERGVGEGDNYRALLDTREFTRISQLDFETQTGSVEAYPGIPLPNPPFPTATSFVVHNTVCQPTYLSTNTFIERVTGVPAVGAFDALNGMKLGFLHYNNRDLNAFYSSHPTDPLSHLGLLQYHGASSSRLAAHRTECNTLQSTRGGRFFIEAGTGAPGAHLANPYAYVERLAPQIARAVLQVEMLM